MRQRIYWLLPDLSSARRTMDDLLLARVEERHIHFAAREDIDLSELHPANVLQTSDVLRAAQSGLVIGGATGTVAGVLVALWLPGSLGEQWGLVAVLGLLGGAIGAWAASMIGISVPSHRLARFERALADGQLLLMVDVPRRRVEAIEALLAAAHPEAHFEGVEPDVPAFP